MLRLSPIFVFRAWPKGRSSQNAKICTSPPDFFLPYFPQILGLLISYHTYPKIWTSTFYYLKMCLKCWTRCKQYRPWSDAIRGVWSGSTLFAQTCLSQFSGLLRQICIVQWLYRNPRQYLQVSKQEIIISIYFTNIHNIPNLLYAHLVNLLVPLCLFNRFQIFNWPI